MTGGNSGRAPRLSQGPEVATALAQHLVRWFNAVWFATFGLDEHLEAELALARGKYERSARMLERLVAETEGTLERVSYEDTRRMMRRLGFGGGSNAIETKKRPEASPVH